MANNIKRRLNEISNIDWNYDADIINSLTHRKNAGSNSIVCNYNSELIRVSSSWDAFINEVHETEITNYLKYLSQLSINTIQETRNILVLKSVLAIKQGLLDSVPKELVVRGILELLHADSDRKKVYYFSDTIKDGDIAKSKIQDHYEIINERYGVDIQVVDCISSIPGKSLQSGSQIIDFLGSRAELESEYHLNKIHKSAHILVNNASRAKFADTEYAQGSDCLWARVRDPKTNALHNIIGVDHDAFIPFREYIDSLFIIKGFPSHPKLSDLSKGTQFRSLKYFIIPQALCTITKGGCPPGFAVTKVDIHHQIPKLEIGKDEVIIVNPDHFLNAKSLSNHPDGILGISRHLGVTLDSEVKADFFHPDTNELIDTRVLIITEYLGKHSGKDTITNGSSRGLNGYILPEIGRSWSKSNSNDYAFYIKKMPIGTRVKISRIVN